MEFTFGVLTYNSEEFILDNLNSIKYQVLNYAHDISVDIIVSDDGSMDRTVELESEWLKNNAGLFRSVHLFTSKNNQGTVKNYHRIIHAIKTSYFHIIAGDDLYASTNIFNIVKLLNQHECICSFPISLDNNNHLFIEKHRLVRNIAMHDMEPITKSKMVRATIFGSYVHTPSTLFLLEDYSANVERYVERFVLYEDDPKWYFFARSGFNFRYIFKPFVIYRYHSASVAHGNNSGVLSRFDKDRLKLIDDYQNDSECTLYLKM